jgi:hypothetical protein
VRDDIRHWGRRAPRGPWSRDAGARRIRRRMMPLFNLFVVLVIVGVILWLANAYILKGDEHE